MNKAPSDEDLFDYAAQKYHKALSDLSAAEADNERLRGLLREAQEWIDLIDDDGRMLDARIDVALAGTADQPPAYHTDPTGTEREPPHCPTCGCGVVDQPSGVKP